MIHAFFYKQHFYKQSQAEIKQKIRNTPRLNLKSFSFFIQVIIQK